MWPRMRDDYEPGSADPGQSLVKSSGQDAWEPGAEPGSGAVDSVNGKTGDVVLSASDVGIPTSADDGDVLTWDDGSGAWVARSGTSVTVNGVEPDESGNITIDALTWDDFPTLAVNRVPDPQSKTSGAATYAMTRITTGLPEGFAHGIESARTGSLNSIVATITLGGATNADPLRIPVTPGETVVATAYEWCDQPSCRGKIDLLFYDATDTLLSTEPQGAWTDMATSTWTRVEGDPEVVPAGATLVRPRVQMSVAGGKTVTGALGRTTGLQVDVDTAKPYGDGTREGWVWSGTAHASASRKIFATGGGGGGGTVDGDAELVAWTAGEAYQATSATYDASGIVSTATVVWPDGGTGTLTVTASSAEHGTVDGYNITHTERGRRVTQPTVTRATDGTPTTVPALTVGAI